MINHDPDRYPVLDSDSAPALDADLCYSRFLTRSRFNNGQQFRRCKATRNGASAAARRHTLLAAARARAASPALQRGASLAETRGFPHRSN
ncbi:hypothetical protein EVAR_12826_1 [Eumeta japonica]|uniref:Uncharacterized protein n=1 Tax=Eumeta variegata TaxID=151549 RepID=A0A4C1UC81_EUMVA|nr:hypothetical protein EVAR_12826_1 [Eumeta japonica]